MSWSAAGGSGRGDVRSPAVRKGRVRQVGEPLAVSASVRSFGACCASLTPVAQHGGRELGSSGLGGAVNQGVFDDLALGRAAAEPFDAGDR